jgi:hypothetical protein
LVILALCSGWAAAADATDGSRPVDVPDPIGLGERLALIDWLQEHRIEFKPDSEMPVMRLLYLHAAHPELFAAEVDEQRGREEASSALWIRHRVNADQSKAVAELREQLRSLDEKLDVQQHQQREEQLKSGGPPPESTKKSDAKPAAPVEQTPQVVPYPPPAESETVPEIRE